MIIQYSIASNIHYIEVDVKNSTSDSVRPNCSTYYFYPLLRLYHRTDYYKRETRWRWEWNTTKGSIVAGIVHYISSRSLRGLERLAAGIKRWPRVSVENLVYWERSIYLLRVYGSMVCREGIWYCLPPIPLTGGVMKPLRPLRRRIGRCVCRMV